MNREIRLYNKKDYSLNKTCGFIINRDLPAMEVTAGCHYFNACSKEKLKKYFEERIEVGITHFIIQLGYSISELIVEIVDEIRQNLPEIELEVIIPAKEYENTQEVERIIEKCTKITAIAEKVNDTSNFECCKKIFDVCGELLLVSNEIKCDLKIDRYQEKCKQYILAALSNMEEQAKQEEFYRKVKEFLSEEEYKIFRMKYNNYVKGELEKGFKDGMAYAITISEKDLL